MWYEGNALDGIVISNRIRLARNLRSHHFPIKMNEEEAEQIIANIKNVLPGLANFELDILELKNLSGLEKQYLVNTGLISPLLTQVSLPTMVVYNQSREVSMMINEEDHIRIQCIEGGKNIENTWKIASQLDDELSEKLEYAFHKDYGYMTSCITNVGTGLRASYMLHLPMLSKTGQMIKILESLQSLGMQIRGMHGEGTKALGDVYQISNQVTLGRSEKDLIAIVKNVTDNLVQKENYIRENLTEHARRALMDKLYRSYGILKYARELSIEEAMELLSDIKLGFELEGYDIKKPTHNIYEIMLMCQNGVILSKPHEEYHSLNALRAYQIRKYLED